MPPMFSPRARIGRLRYLARLTCGYFLLLVAMMIGAVAIAVAGLDDWGPVFLAAGLALYVAAAIVWTIQRSHDMDWSAWSGLATLIPIVGFVWFFKPGTIGANRFGDAPPANTTGVVLAALVFPLLVVGGVVSVVVMQDFESHEVLPGRPRPAAPSSV
jgi:uncharacterized membrane protein YhaH (DUF805 family)